MINFGKRKILMLAAVVLLLACMLALTGCNGDKVDDIAISDSGKPRTVYVQGQDLDLKTGVLTVISNGETVSVPMNAEGVTVSGYNKDQIGKQTITLMYKGKSITMEVIVVARMSVEEYELNYFVGDSFDKTKGKVKLAKDDGTFTSVNLDSADVVISGFDSSKSGTVDVKATYNGAGGPYEATFAVKIYEPGEITFTKPSKAAYQSHETELVLTGGYFTVVAADNPSFSKYVNITPEMTSGFDPSAATEEHKSQPLKQTVTVTYANQTFQYEVSILYGSISMIQHAAEMLKDLDWTQETVTITPQQGEAAKDAMLAYFQLTNSDKELIDEVTLKTVVLPAAQYVSEKFLEEAESYNKSFRVNEDGNLLFEGKEYHQLGIDRDRLADKHELFNVYAELLRQMKEAFVDMVIRDQETVGTYIKVPPKEDVDFYIIIFDYLMGLHDNLNVIPADWTVDTLEQYADNINMAVYLIQLNGLIGPNFSYIYETMANWRENNDYFDIIYEYYCYIAEDGEEFIREELWQKLPLPGDMQDWYLAFYNAVVESQYMRNNGEQEAYLRDTTAFMYYFFEANKLAEEIKNGDNQLYKDVYDIIEGDMYMVENILAVPAGYLDLSLSLADCEEFVALWDQYMAVYRLYVYQKYDKELHKGEVEKLMDCLMELTPLEVYQFLSSLHYLYGETGGTFHAFDYSERISNSLIAVLVNYYVDALPESARPAFMHLMLAVENYALSAAIEEKTVALEGFKRSIAALDSLLASLSAEDRAIFDSLLGDYYRKYHRYYEVSLAPQDFQIPANAVEKLEELKTTLGNFMDILAYMSSEGLSQTEYRYTCIQLCAAYEKANSLYVQLRAMDSEDLRLMLATEAVMIGEYEQTVDMAYGNVRTYFMYWMVSGLRFDIKDDNGEKVGQVPTWVLYEDSQSREFLLEAADLLIAGFNKTLYLMEEAYVMQVVDSFLKLDSEEMLLLYGIGIHKYLDCLANYFTNMIQDEKSKNMAIAVLDVQFGYIVYNALGHQDKELVYFKDLFENARDLYEQLEDKTEFDRYLRTMYEYYEEYYKSLTA